MPSLSPLKVCGLACAAKLVPSKLVKNVTLFMLSVNVNLALLLLFEAFG